jgi:rhomboid protease GluP
MLHVKEKFRLIFVPFLIILCSYVVLNTFLYWLFIIHGKFHVNVALKVCLWIGLPWIPVWIWLRPRLKLLKFKKDNGSVAAQLLAVIAIIAPSIIAEQYIETATGRLTALGHIYQLKNIPETKYYSVKDYHIDKRNIGVYRTARVSGKRRRDYYMMLYITMPILDDPSDTFRRAYPFWLGKMYSKRISNRKSKETKDAAYRQFVEESRKEFEATDFNAFTYLEVVGNTDHLQAFRQATLRSRFARYSNPVIFTAVNKPYSKRNGNKLVWIFGSAVLGASCWFFLLLLLKFKETTTPIPEN